MGLDKTENAATSEGVQNPEDFKSIVDGIEGHGVISGLAVTENGTPDLDVIIASGTAIVNGTKVTKGSSTNITLIAAHASNARNDVISINSSGTITATKGDDSSDGPRLVPATPANEVRLGVVYRPAADDVINNSQISDARIIEKVYQDALDSGMFNVANGIPKLNGSADVPLAQIPDTLTGKKTTLNLTRGNYIGDGTINRSIAHGLGTKPKRVTMVCTSNLSHYFILSQTSGNILYQFDEATATAHGVPDMDATNFYVGRSGDSTNSANNSGWNYWWLAFW